MQVNTTPSLRPSIHLTTNATTTQSRNGTPRSKESLHNGDDLAASPATVLTLQSRVLSIAQFLRSELQKIEDNLHNEASASSKGDRGGEAFFAPAK